MHSHHIFLPSYLSKRQTIGEHLVFTSLYKIIRLLEEKQFWCLERQLKERQYTEPFLHGHEILTHEERPRYSSVLLRGEVHI